MQSMAAAALEIITLLMIVVFIKSSHVANGSFSRTFDLLILGKPRSVSKA